MIKHLFEDLIPKQQGIVNGFLFARRAQKEATLTYDRCKDALIDNLGSDAEIILSPDSHVLITTAIKDTTEWKVAFMELARLTYASDTDRKAATRKATNSVTATAVRVFEPKPASNKKGVAR